MDSFRKVIQQKKALFQILIMKGYNEKRSYKWKEAGTFVPARMKKKNIKLRKT